MIRLDAWSTAAFSVLNTNMRVSKLSRRLRSTLCSSPANQILTVEIPPILRTPIFASQVIVPGSGIVPINIENPAIVPTPVINDLKRCTSSPPVSTDLE